jgi:hypothetical protein
LALLPKKPWEETEQQFEARLKKIAQTINQDYNVADLCREFPQRINKMVEVGGEKLST